MRDIRDILSRYPLDNTSGWKLRAYDSGLSVYICNLYGNGEAPALYSIDKENRLKSVVMWFERRGVREKQRPNRDPWGRKIPNYVDRNTIISIDGINGNDYDAYELFTYSNDVSSLGRVSSTSVDGQTVYLVEVYGTVELYGIRDIIV